MFSLNKQISQSKVQSLILNRKKVVQEITKTESNCNYSNYIHISQFIFAMEQPEQLEYHIYRDYQVQEKVGKGTYGIVYKAIHKKTKQLIAIKKIIDAFQNLIDAKRTYRELNYLLQLQHPCIVQLHHILLNPRKGQAHQPSTTRLAPPQQEIRGCNTDKLSQKPSALQRHVYAIFQFVETDLKMVLKRCSQLQPIHRKFIAYQLLQGIAYLHRSGLIHRDIKPQNLLINCNKLELKICDFGMARLSVSNSASQGVLTQYVASRWYRPPEALLGISTCEPAIDLWSVGCVIAELALCTPIFQGKSTLDQLEVIFKCLGMPEQSQINKLSSVQAQYVLKCFTFSRKARFRSLNELLTMCSSQEIELISKFLKFNPKQRISAEQALKHPYFDEVRTLNPVLDQFSKNKSHINDITQIGQLPQSQERAQNKNTGIENYRFLIQQLEKYAQKSTCSDPALVENKQISTKISQINNFISEDQQNLSSKQKSTKESNFVSQNKQNFLSPSKKLFIKPVQQQNESLQNKTDSFKNINWGLQSKKLFQKGHKMSKTKISEHYKQKKSRDKSKKQIREKQLVSKPKLKQKTPTKLETQSSALFLADRRNENKLKVLKKKKSIHMDKSMKKLSQISLLKPRKTQGGDGNSIISNNSNLSLARSKSKQMSKNKEIQMPNTVKKQELVKKLVKNCKNLTKTGVNKCKSNANIRGFKK